MTYVTKPEYGYDAVTDDAILMTPTGIRFGLVLISYTKYVLTTCKMKPQFRLELLEAMDRLLDGRLTDQVLGLVQPAGAVEAEIIESALSLDAHLPEIPTPETGGVSRDKAFPLLTGELFPALLKLNSSLVDAIRLMAWPRGAAAA
jgi:hypothetical protein